MIAYVFSGSKESTGSIVAVGSAGVVMVAEVVAVAMSTMVQTCKKVRSDADLLELDLSGFPFFAPFLLYNRSIRLLTLLVSLSRLRAKNGIHRSSSSRFDCRGNTLQLTMPLLSPSVTAKR
jgi:hypothetical protein